MIAVAILDDYLGCALDLADWSRLGPDVRVEHFTSSIPADRLIETLAQFDAVCLMRDRTAMPRSVIGQLPRLRFISYTGGSCLVLDGEAAADAGITVCTTQSPGGIQEHFEFIWALIMATMREIPANDAAMRAGAWQTKPGRALHGKTIGILGLGNFGPMVAHMAAQFGMQVLAWSQNLTPERAEDCGATAVSFETLMAQSDVVSIHLRLSERTRGLVDGAALARMKPGAVLINVSRGLIVNEFALIAALQSGRISAGLDVFDHEPLPRDHVLRSLPNVVLSPHMGFSTEQLLASFHRQSLENVEAWLAGAPVRVVDADVIAGRAPAR